MALEITDDNVSIIEHVNDEGTHGLTELHYGSEKVWPQKTYDVQYLCLTADKTFTVRIDTWTYSYPLEYSINMTGWHKVNMSSIDITVESGDKLYLRGDAPSVSGAEDETIQFYQRGEKNGAKIKVSGDLMSIFSYKDVSLQIGWFFRMFAALTELYDASELILPPTIWTTRQYDAMFKSTNLRYPPKLPSKTLAQSCYLNMFESTDIEEMPELPATELARSCYDNMFSFCRKLTVVKPLPATVLAEGCYFQMFAGCSALEVAPTIEARYMANNSCYNMFAWCDNLRQAPILYAKTLIKDCYRLMFYDCPKLKYLKVYFEDWGEGTQSWLENTGEEGVIEIPSVLEPKTGRNYIPQKWSYVTFNP